MIHEDKKFKSKMYCLNDNEQLIDGDADLTIVYNNPHKIEVMTDEYFGMNGEVFMRLTWMDDNKASDTETEINPITTHIMNIMEKDENEKYTELMNAHMRGEIEALSTFEYKHDKSGVYFIVLRTTVKKEDKKDVRPTRTVNLDQG
ncbi:MAG: hypothetical protein SVK08_01905 [Halobacteriota archaeon]|nr:hypothetical protein [Halobacteriota archaeon]